MRTASLQRSTRLDDGPSSGKVNFRGRVVDGLDMVRVPKDDARGSGLRG